MGPFRTQRRAQDIVEEHAAPLIAKDREYAELALEVAARTARHPPSTRRRKHATAGAGRYPTKLKCEACGAVMLDCEACQSGGEYNHPYNGCRNASLSFTDLPEARGVWPGLVSARQRARGIVPVQPSRFRRAKRRGARAASRSEVVRFISVKKPSAEQERALRAIVVAFDDANTKNVARWGNHIKDINVEDVVYHDNKGNRVGAKRRHINRKTLFALEALGLITVKTEVKERSSLRRGAYGKWLGGTTTHTYANYSVAPTELGLQFCSTGSASKA